MKNKKVNKVDSDYLNEDWSELDGYYVGSGYYAQAPRCRPSDRFRRPIGESFTVSGWNDLPSVIISNKANKKMWHLIQECDIEVSWLSSVSRDSDGDFVIDDVFVPKQSCGPASTNIDEDGDAELLMELLSQGKAAEINKIRCWGHSHVNMPTGSSVTDEKQTEDFLSRFDDFFVRFIGNKRGDLECHVYIKEQGMILNHPDIILQGDADDDFDYKSWASEQIESKVTRTVYYYPNKYKKTVDTNLHSEYIVNEDGSFDYVRRGDEEFYDTKEDDVEGKKNWLTRYYNRWYS